MVVSSLLKKIVSISIALFLISACSGGKNLSVENKEAKSEKELEAVYLHEHPINPCTGEVAHSHKYDLKELEQHKHKYNCEATRPVISNAHNHEAIPEKGVRSYRHVHPNGSNDHFHNEAIIKPNLSTPIYQ